jgi:hypothetical protein
MIAASGAEPDAVRRPLFVLSGQPDILVGLFSWPGYDGGSRENEAGFGAKTPYKKLFSHYLK